MDDEAKDERSAGDPATDVAEQATTSGQSAYVPSAARLQELLDKRRRAGLSDEEANELGRIFAERESKPYANARSLKEGRPE